MQYSTSVGYLLGCYRIRFTCTCDPPFFLTACRGVLLYSFPDSISTKTTSHQEDGVVITIAGARFKRIDSTPQLRSSSHHKCQPFWFYKQMFAPFRLMHMYQMLAFALPFFASFFSPVFIISIEIAKERLKERSTPRKSECTSLKGG